MENKLVKFNLKIFTIKKNLLSILTLVVTVPMCFAGSSMLELKQSNELLATKKTILALPQPVNPLKGRKRGGDLFEEGSKTISVGYGFGTFYTALFSAWSTTPGYTASNLGPIFVKGEYGVTDKIGIGLTIGYETIKNSWTAQGYDMNFNPVNYNYGWNFSLLSVMIHGNYHFYQTDKFDVYAGASLGYANFSTKFTTNDPNYGPSPTISIPIAVGYGINIGAKYYFTPNIAVYGEVGYELSYANLGLTFKL